MEQLNASRTNPDIRGGEKGGLLENNNSCWGLGDITGDEMSEMGVDFISFSDDENTPFQPFTRDFSPPQELEEFDKCKRVKLMKEEDFLYRRKSLPFSERTSDLFSKLSDEIVLCILGHLPHSCLGQVAMISHRFSRLVRDESLWRRLDLSSRNLRTDNLAHVLTRGVRILRLTVSKVCSPIFLETGKLLEGFHSKLEYLDLSECAITVQDLEQLLSKCRALKKISLEACDLNDGVCREIGQNYNLETLNCCLCTGITAKGISAIVSNCKKLNDLNLGWCSLKRDSVDILCRNLTSNIKTLNLSGCQETITDLDVQRLVTRCSSLLNIDLSDCLRLTGSSVMFIVANLRSLRAVSLSRCFRINPQSFVLLGELPKLETVNAYKQIPSDQIPEFEALMPRVSFNKEPFSEIARPTVGIRRTSIWGIRCRE